ncbi:hypothetical protein [Bacillus sp. SM2101]|uniref:hypothetical protein n=1 Tax=Bacillus sp. SM2101 TaxID=2805366 RepID=UPI001BDE2168|nr:hypothetical protein [Bacillus sp. SM2101]
MIKDKEMEFRKAFNFLKRSAKSPLTSSYTRGYTAGNAQREPSQKIYDYILELEKDASISFEEKISKLDIFLQKAEEEQRKKPLMGTPMNRDFRSYIKVTISNIEKGEPVQTRRV